MKSIFEDLLGSDATVTVDGEEVDICGVCSYVTHLPFSSICDEATEGWHCDSFVFPGSTPAPSVIHRAFPIALQRTDALCLL